jgi:Zn-dependent protease
MFFNVLFTLNVSLAVFNFLPVPPLDGFNFINSLTSNDNGFVNFMRDYGRWILLLILVVFSDLLTMFIGWISMPMMLFWGWIL